MDNEQQIIFEPFSLDLVNQCLWRGSEVIRLRPKAFAVLKCVLSRPGQLVTKEELLNSIWPETFVSDAVVKVTIRQLRRALDDDPKSPRFIETAHRRGYRFIGHIAESARITADGKDRSSTAIPFSRLPDGSLREFVGRDEALTRLQGWLQKMLGGERQIIFVTGESGIGKTALVDTFARSIAFDQRIRIGRGQCLEQYGTGEAYLPVLEAIGRLCREQSQVADVLHAHAPMWLLQMPSLVSDLDREVLNRRLAGATRERMLREMGEALEVLTAETPLVLILEDLHWSDYSTLDLISYLARQRQPAQLMLIGTYRTVDLIVSGHPLQAVKQELLAKHQCEQLPLEYLSKNAVHQYLSLRFPGNRFPAGLASLIHERTEGSALFMVNTVDFLVTEGLIVKDEQGWKLAVEIEKVEVGVPDSIKQMIEKQLDHLDAEKQRTLEAASVAGAEFSTLAVAAGLEEDLTLVEAQCNELARHHQFIQDRGVQELPNGAASMRYGFIHALYQNVLYERMADSRRVQLHRRIGARGEDVYGEDAREIAAELAMHFERGRDYKRAAKHFQQAADNATRRFAYHEAVGLARRGLELLQKIPNSAERAAQELAMQLTLGVPLIVTEGYAAPDVGNVYLKARELCQQLGGTTDVSEVLWGLRTYHTMRAEFATAREIAEEFLGLAERLPYSGLAMRGHWAMEIIFLHLGEFTLALEHYEKALSFYDPKHRLERTFTYVQNPAVTMRCFAAWSLWFLGYPEQAAQRINEAVSLARESSEPYGLAQALFFSAVLYQLRREARKAQKSAEAAIAVSREHGLVLYQAMSTATRGWALMWQGLQEEGIEQMVEGLANHRLTGAEVILPHFLALLVEAFARTDQVLEGLRVLEESLGVVSRNGERYYLAELYRIKGELLVLRATDRCLSRAAPTGKTVLEARHSEVAQAEACFHQSIEIARQQKAKSWELRAVMSLARLFQSQHRCAEAHGLLEQIYGKFTEGFDTADLKEGKALLDELSKCDTDSTQRSSRTRTG